MKIEFRKAAAICMTGAIAFGMAGITAEAAGKHVDAGVSTVLNESLTGDGEVGAGVTAMLNQSLTMEAAPPRSPHSSETVPYHNAPSAWKIPPQPTALLPRWKAPNTPGCTAYNHWHPASPADLR